jgi:hypothetical protein
MDAAILMRRLVSSGICAAEEIVGCSKEEIQSIESSTGIELPEAYKSFLSIAGRSAGNFMRDLTIFFPEVSTLTDRVRRDFEGVVQLPERAFVFADRMGEAFLYVVADGSGDPPVYGWSESRDEAERVYGSIWEFIEAELVEAES